MYVGITGTLGAGKGEVVKILKKRGFVHYSFGDMLRRMCEQRGIQPSVENSMQLANELRKKHSPGYLAEQLLHRLEDKAPEHAVLESIRNPAELEVLRRLPGFILLSVDAPREIRWERSKHRGRLDGIASFEQFSSIEDKQFEGQNYEQNLLAVMDNADVQLVNIGTVEELERQLEEALNI